MASMIPKSYRSNCSKALEPLWIGLGEPKFTGDRMGGSETHMAGGDTVPFKATE